MAIAMSVAGTALLVGGGCGRPLGIALGTGAALIYSIYITVGTVVTAGVHPLAVTTVVSTSAAVMSGIVAVTQATGGHAPSFPESAAGWGALLAVALVGTVIAIMAFFAGLQRLGATQTALLSTMEPVLTIALATWLLNESMTTLQLCGGLVVLVAVMWQALGRRLAPEDEDERGLVLEDASTPPV
jgi:drug/metabolite transporter (DMT)-like permease